MAISQLKRLEIGQVEIKPGLLFLKTELDNDVILVPGFLNPIAAFSGVQVNDGDFIFVNGAKGSEMYVASVSTGGLRAANGVITMLNVTPLTFTFPQDAGMNGAVLTSNGDGTTSWVGGGP